ncbi:hypothetical protein P7D22_02255 [Lichenihabitans sp. Uapishka_5]|uniref:hypothetical protein n=1 Tax=Lichenihabitans sp. Uapishka_5 TaxID=3037302 RepID=UPI0029E815D0|nr:hypothetical protein [Lichenihabitans sp. Uapishka_5]MDX7949998.1 hypothetical protein [Lichenihabitans sp. Uapishka_5]
MLQHDKARRIGFAIMGVAGCLVLAGCGAAGTPGFEPETQGGPTLSSKLANLVAFNKLFPSAAPLPQTEVQVECPSIEVLDGTASVRTYAGEQSNANVRYQFSLGDIARECSKAGGNLLLKVGAEGRVLLGPSGSPGAFTVPIRVAVRNDATQKVVFSQLNRISASIASGTSETAFTYVSEPFQVPIVAHPDEDYTILVGFDPTGAGVVPAKSAMRARRKG